MGEGQLAKGQNASYKCQKVDLEANNRSISKRGDWQRDVCQKNIDKKNI